MGQARQFSGGTQTAFTPKRANAYLERSYYGGPEHECPYCGAVFLVPGASEEGFICHTTKNCVQSLLEERKIDLKPYEKPPSILANLLRFDGDVRSKRILKLIRSYNSLFVFTSFGAAIDKTINNGTAPYVFKINGVVHHRIGTLLPQRGLGIFKDDDGTAGKPENEITMALLNMLDDHNKLVIAFRYARDRLEQEGDQKITPKLLGCNTKHDVQYSLPSSGEIAAIIVGDYAAEEYTYDVPVHDKECGLRRISCLHPSYMALQYPLLFPYGEHGFHLGIRYSDADDSDERKRKYVTHLEFVRRHMHYRLNEANPYTCYGRLSDQIVVDSYSTIEGSRLQFIADHQKELRFESVQGIADAIDKGLISADSVGGRKIVPASFTGGQRYHMMNYQDAMAICKVYGPPDLFVTFTCNTKWREIVDALRFEPGQQPCDRSDLIVRVFHMKVDEFIADIREGRTFGPVLAVLYTVEFQKSGLPHIHCLVWLADGNKEFSASVVDDFICAEIPDVSTDPLGYALVDEFMMHGPCGDDNKKCPCMKDDKCSKNFPKAFQNETNVDDFGFTIYRRRNDGRYVVKNGVPLDNRNVVPYNMHLLKKYNAHINVEWCNKSNMIKYLFKYVTKGSDRAKVYFEITAKTSNASPGPQLAPPNEIQEYINARYLSTCEALWRGFEYDIHFRVPPVERLVVHLPGLNHVRYEPGADLRALLASPAAKSTMLTEWFEANLRHEEARHLTYCEFPKEWTWDASDRCWRQRARGAKIGRMYYVHPAAGELYYLRMLLMMVKGCKNYADVRTFNTKVYSTFRDACEARGLLEGDNEWNLLFDEAVVSASAYQLRQLFVTVVLYCSVGNVRALFDRYWLYFIDDIRRRLTDALGNPNYSVPHEQLMSLLIQTLTSVFANSGGNIRDYDLPTLTTEHVVMGENRLINDELDPEPLMLSMHAASLVAQLNSDQRNVYDKITGCVLSGSSGFFFLSGHGGTGKTFLWNAIIASLRSEKKIVLAVASSGVASLLLPRGRTAHSRFKIPFDITEAGTCNVKRGTMLAELIQVASLIIWDKAPMTHRRCFEALDITMRDILSKCMSSNANLPFGGKPIVLGDFRQILPIVVFVGTLVKKYADGLCLSGGSPCKWYINPDIPEAKMLMARARSVHKPIKWNEILASSRPVVPAVEEQKVSYIKYLHPFENKRKEFLVIVTIKKIDKKWWYNSCRKCTHTAEHRGDTYKCINTDCNTVGASTQRYKLFLTAGDETGDTDFVLFGRIAQRLVKRLADILIAENLVGFMPDTITKLLERTFIWNVSFTKNTITSGNVNAVVGEIDTENDAIPMSQGGSHQSSLMVSQGASSSLQNTPEKGGKADTEDKSGTDPGENASVLGDSSTTKKQENTARKRSRSSPNKATAKMLFTDGDDGGHDDQGSAEDTSEPGYYPYPLIHFKQCLDVEKQMQRWYCTDHITLGSRSTWRKKITP
ncbi:hypothetical protein U9M48_035226 [Paspalum notatum var. saurae]|uniref:ATP-dependent DNA helicase n=1 Tax=Paspalum notatum var. saurae TaxID=547442 RepID=A0AAQ3UES8_PASNO